MASSPDRFTAAIPQLHDYLVDSAQRVPDKVALVCQRGRLTYGELEAESNQLANAFVRRGVRRGDRVLILADNTAETVVAFWAALKANAVACPVSPLMKAPKLAGLIEDCTPVALIGAAIHVPLLTAAAEHHPLPATVVLAGPEGAARLAEAGPEVLAWNDATALEGAGTAPSRSNIDVDLASIIYTSGSTGAPKGIMLTHRNMLTAATSITAYLENSEDDVILSALPLSFDYGLYQVIMAFRVGARVVLERSFAYPTQVLRDLASEGATGFPGVPTMFATLAGMTGLEQYDFSSVRYVTNTAAAIAAKHVSFIRRTFSSARFYSMYGLTECKRCTYLPPEDLDSKPDSVGIAIPNTELWIVDDDGNRVGPNAVGQLVIRGATVMKGYWNKPEATAHRLRPGPLSGEQVLFTGDLCRTDEDGHVYFVARMDQIIKSRGEKVAPREVEAALLDIPGILEAAVVGIPDTILGVAVKAFVVLEAESRLTPADIRVQCQARLEPHMVPAQVVIVPELPRTTSMKVDKKALL
ncbi:MAG TPA: AMP-binding protein [Vicinamibacterales bacterium]|jgi:amino acid adenylation domain-containing protein